MPSVAWAYSGLNAADVTLTNQDNEFSGRYDSGTAVSPVDAGCARVTAQMRYSVGQGYGWRLGSSQSMYDHDCRSGKSLDRDCNCTQEGTFVVDVPDGVCQVELWVGDRARQSCGSDSSYRGADWLRRRRKCPRLGHCLPLSQGQACGSGVTPQRAKKKSLA